jgi:hypothetical protein
MNSPAEPSHHAVDGGDVDPGPAALGGGLVVGAEPSVAHQPGERALNGIITNDKFCLSRPGRLQLSWPRARRPVPAPTPRYPPDEIPHRGGEYETPLARPAHPHPGSQCRAALGPGLPAPPAVGVGRSGTDASVAPPPGGAPCA